MRSLMGANTCPYAGVVAPDRTTPHEVGLDSECGAGVRGDAGRGNGPLAVDADRAR